VLTVNRALQNPGLFTSDHYRQAAIAVAAGVAIRILVAIPVRLPLSDIPTFEDLDGHSRGQEFAHKVAEDLSRHGSPLNEPTMIFLGSPLACLIHQEQVLTQTP
jgi:hypothetical protein